MVLHGELYDLIELITHENWQRGYSACKDEFDTGKLLPKGMRRFRCSVRRALHRGLRKPRMRGRKAHRETLSGGAVGALPRAKELHGIIMKSFI